MKPNIKFQDEILREEYDKWGMTFRGIDKRKIDKEEKEYEEADAITIPSDFVKESFIKKGIPESKLVKIPYGVRLERFQKIDDPDKNKFRILWVGIVDIRKGFLYLLEAFNRFSFQNKELVVIGNISPTMKKLFRSFNLKNVIFIRHVHNSELPKYYSTSHVFALPSIEDGFGMVLGEALACGCPIISTVNTGARDLITDKVEGFIIPIRSYKSILEKFQYLADNPVFRKKMSSAARIRIKKLGGWDSYGEKFRKLLLKVNSEGNF